MSNTRFLRNKDLIDQRQLDTVAVVGAGGIGSAVIQLLAIMGFKDIYINRSLLSRRFFIINVFYNCFFVLYH